MNRLIYFPIILCVLIFGLYSFNFSKNSFNSKKQSVYKTTKFPKEITELVGDLVYVSNGTFVSELIIGDSVYFPSRQVSVQSFYMNKAEVTNLQYRNFYNDMVKLVGKDSAQFYLPDSATFSKSLPFGFVEPMTKHYFSHPSYDNYPVVGINWKQAKGYVAWINLKMDEIYKKHPDWLDKYALNHFRIPTEMEWEYAAKGNATRTFYSWGNHLFKAEKERVIWNGNFGIIRDENGVEIKSYMDDNSFFMSEVTSYSPNIFGIYNMSGNVNEWVEDAFVDRNKSDYDFNPYLDSTYNIRNNYGRTFNIDYLENNKTVKNNRVIKGGSFLDSPAYCMVGNRRGMDADSSRCDVGFRLCATFYRNPEGFSSK